MQTGTVQSMKCDLSKQEPHTAAGHEFISRLREDTLIPVSTLLVPHKEVWYKPNSHAICTNFPLSEVKRSKQELGRASPPGLRSALLAPFLWDRSVPENRRDLYLFVNIGPIENAGISPQDVGSPGKLPCGNSFNLKDFGNEIYYRKIFTSNMKANV